MAFEVAIALHISETEALAYPASQLVHRYEWIEEAEWQRVVSAISATETGVGRALLQALAGKSPDKLPTYDEVLRRQRHERPPLPDWQQDFEEANRDRHISQVQRSD
jgi:hypothetical protein